MICDNPYAENYTMPCSRCGLCGEFERKVQTPAEATESPVQGKDGPNLAPKTVDNAPICEKDAKWPCHTHIDDNGVTVRVFGPAKESTK